MDRAGLHTAIWICWVTETNRENINVKYIYPAMTAFTDQYSLPNIFFDIGQL
jgi:hypothetical protein